MAHVQALFPPSPANVPPDLASPSRSYRIRVVVVLGCLILFLAVYLALTLGSAYLSYASFADLFGDNQRGGQGRTQYGARKNRSGLFLFVGGVASALLCLFMVKGLFKRSQSDSGVKVEATENDQPELFAFIRQLCRDTRAPFPHRVYLVVDVNAAVTYQESMLNLILPARKNLIIGLGLVNRLNLTEFKAVLAHEFGHFSQKSMKLGNYVYTANRLVADVVYGRDRLDDFLATLRGTDIRIAAFAYSFSGVLWVLRKGLAGLFRGINFAHTSLSRQMEYNADLVAVSVTGSDALIFALARLDFASATLGQAWADLSIAADHNRFSRDLYYHQTRAVEYLRARASDPTLGTVPALPDDPRETVQVFKPEDTSVPKMWATHPTNHNREQNAKRRYIRGPRDERTAWVLFQNADRLREEVTSRVYETARKTRPESPEEPEAVQAFIDAEHAETTYAARYHGLYDNRYLRPGDGADTGGAADAAFAERHRLAEAYAGLHGADLPERMAAHRSRQREVNQLNGLARGAVALTGKDFEHRGGRHSRGDADRLLKQVELEIEQDFEWMHGHDQRTVRIHNAMAKQLGGTIGQELQNRYRFHLAVQEIHAKTVACQRHLEMTLADLTGQRQVSPEVFQNALAAFRGVHELLAEQLTTAQTLYLPELTNMTPGAPLAPLLLADPLVPVLGPNTASLDGQYINRLLGQIGEVLEKSARILFKSMGKLLALQEAIAEQWHGEQATIAAEIAEPGPHGNDGPEAV